jgi:hypothetical protein
MGLFNYADITDSMSEVLFVMAFRSVTETYRTQWALLVTWRISACGAYQSEQAHAAANRSPGTDIVGQSDNEKQWL